VTNEKTIRVYDYVNRPYDEVRQRLTGDAVSVFSKATKGAALRASSVASELRVNIGGIEVVKDIAITILSAEEEAQGFGGPKQTRISLEWEAAKNPRLFPFMSAELRVYPLTRTETQLDLEGNYEPPLGIIGSALDAAVGYKIAEASVHRFIGDVAAYLRAEA
jgi:hypothetical protein